MNKTKLLLLGLTFSLTGSLFAANQTATTITHKEFKDSSTKFQMALGASMLDFNTRNNDKEWTDDAEKIRPLGFGLKLQMENNLPSIFSTTSFIKGAFHGQNNPIKNEPGENYDSKLLNFEGIIGQTINLNFETNGGTIFQPFLSAGVGYGLNKVDLDGNSSTNDSYGSGNMVYNVEMQERYFVGEAELGLNIKLPIGLMPFASVGLRRIKHDSNNTQFNYSYNYTAIDGTTIAQKESDEGSDSDHLRFETQYRAMVGIGYQF
jgi:hypothetical protein